MKEDTKNLLTRALRHWYVDQCHFNKTESERYANEILREITTNEIL